MNSFFPSRFCIPRFAHYLSISDFQDTTLWSNQAPRRNQRSVSSQVLFLSFRSLLRIFCHGRACLLQSDKLFIIIFIFTHKTSHLFTKRIYKLNILPFIFSANIIRLPGFSFIDYCPCSTVMIIHEQPVSYVFPVSVNRKRFFFPDIQYHYRDKLFRKLVRPVIVRTVGKCNRQIICMIICTHKMIG